jgi:hypothetical protein
MTKATFGQMKILTFDFTGIEYLEYMYIKGTLCRTIWRSVFVLEMPYESYNKEMNLTIKKVLEL